MLGQLSQSIRWDSQSPVEFVGRILLALTLILVGYVVYAQKFAALSGIKGPFTASLSRLWLVYHALRADLHRCTPLLHQKYGMDPDILVTCSQVLTTVRQIRQDCAGRSFNLGSGSH
jgi:hypothetical protein